MEMLLYFFMFYFFGDASFNYQQHENCKQLDVTSDSSNISCWEWLQYVFLLSTVLPCNFRFNLLRTHYEACNKNQFLKLLCSIIVVEYGSFHSMSMALNSEPHNATLVLLSHWDCCVIWHVRIFSFLIWPTHVHKNEWN